MQQSQIIGAIKIKDGLFIGDEYAAQDFEFILTNKVTHIVNCAGKQIQNQWISAGIKYLTFDWSENDSEILFDSKDQNLNSIFYFMEGCFSQGESCLVHSVRGQSRSCCVLAAYFMKKYSWTLYKTLEYLNSRRPDLEIRASFFYQLNNLETKISSNCQKRTASWNEINHQDQNNEEELIIRNTFLNSHNSAIDEIYTNIYTKNSVLNKQYASKLKWKDHQEETTELATVLYNGPADYLPIVNYLPIKYQQPILKGSKKNKNQIPLSSLSTSIQGSSQTRSFSNKSFGERDNKLESLDNQLLNQNSGTQNSINNSFQQILQQKLKVDIKQQQQYQQTINQQNKMKQNTYKQSNSKDTKPPLQQILNKRFSTRASESPPCKELEKKQQSIRSSSLQTEEQNQKSSKVNIQIGIHGSQIPGGKSQNSLISDSPLSQIKMMQQLQINSQKSQENLPMSFQEFKNQVQVSLNFFNKEKDSQREQSNRDQNDQFKLSFRVPESAAARGENAASRLKQLDSLISQTQNKPIPQQLSFQTLTKNNSLLNDPFINNSKLQSTYQQFQQLQNQVKQNQLRTSSSSSQIKNISQIKGPSDISKQSQQQKSSQIRLSFETQQAKISSQQTRSNSVPKKTQEETSSINKRPNSAGIEKNDKSLENTSALFNKKIESRNSSNKKNPSPTIKVRKPLINQQGPPLSQSSSIQMKSIQNKRQASSTLRNQRTLNQDPYYPNSMFLNNTNSFNNLSQQQNSFQINENSVLNDIKNDKENRNSQKLMDPKLERQVELIANNKNSLMKSLCDSRNQINAKNLSSPNVHNNNLNSQQGISKVLMNTLKFAANNQ